MHYVCHGFAVFRWHWHVRHSRLAAGDLGPLLREGGCWAPSEEAQESLSFQGALGMMNVPGAG